MNQRRVLTFIFVAVLLGLAAVAVYHLPPVYDRLGWRIENAIAQVRRLVNPPEDVVFVPQGGSGVQPGEAIPTSGGILPPTALPTSTPLPALPAATATPLPALAPTLTPTPIPPETIWLGVTHEYQQMNNCGPATLAMALSFWGWQGDQTDTRLYLRPNFQQVDDKNVDPAEMVAFVESQTELEAIARVGGDIELLKQLIAAGFPVMIEKGQQPHPGDWMGHYVLFSGYDDALGRFISQDSYIMPDLPVPYEQVSDQWWRDFNYTYIVIYPPERELEVTSILGPHTDKVFNAQAAAERARLEIETQQGRDQFFAWYNLGTNLVALGDYAGAAQAYDQAFSIYPTIPEEDRPWRMLWYQAGPYAAYYHTGRYQDVITLGNQTLDSAGGPILEESFYWLGKAREAEGDMEKAIYDYQKAYEINPTSTPARDELERLGIEV